FMSSNRYRKSLLALILVSISYQSNISFAVTYGNLATANGNDSNAIGVKATASGSGSNAFGFESLAKGTNSTAVGNEAVAKG
ncbi:hypothetical protein ABFV54_28140, partial [Pseudomonas syringae]|uniref:hypothetical protein n=1 Tax=Pseudomonas syringae TaxID=317 RepID=UPI0034D45C23